MANKNIRTVTTLLGTSTYWAVSQSAGTTAEVWSRWHQKRHHPPTITFRTSHHLGPARELVHFISRVLQSLWLTSIWLRHHPLRGIDSVRLQILSVGTCRQCGSWSVAGHNRKKVIGRGPICANLHDMDLDPETVQQRPCMMREIETSRAGTSTQQHFAFGDFVFAWKPMHRFRNCFKVNNKYFPKLPWSMCNSVEMHRQTDTQTQTHRCRWPLYTSHCYAERKMFNGLFF